MFVTHFGIPNGQICIDRQNSKLAWAEAGKAAGREKGM